MNAGLLALLKTLVLVALTSGVLYLGYKLLMKYAAEELKKIQDMMGDAVAHVYVGGLWFNVNENKAIVMRNVFYTNPGHLIGWSPTVIESRGISKSSCSNKACKQARQDKKDEERAARIKPCTDESHRSLGPLAFQVDAPVHSTKKVRGELPEFFYYRDKDGNFIEEPEQGQPDRLIKPGKHPVPDPTPYNNMLSGVQHHYEGFSCKQEGLRVWMPMIQDDIFGVVDLRPVTTSVDRDYEFNTLDNQEVLIKFRFVTKVVDPIAFLIRVGNEQRAAWEKEQVIALIQKMTNAYSADQLTGADNEKIGALGNLLTEVYNTFMAAYGLEATNIQILQISPPAIIAERAAQKKAAEIAREAANDEGLRIKRIIDQTGGSADEVTRAIALKDMVNLATTAAVRMMNMYEGGRAADRRETKKKEKAA